MPGSIQASTVCDTAAVECSIAATCERMIREQAPNLFRLYVNPYVAQACYCLTRLLAEAWPSIDADEYQVFLANSGEEALSGAIKLARYTASAQGGPHRGLIVDQERRFEHFAFIELAGHGRLEFIPGVEVTGAARLADRKSPIGFLVLPPASLPSAAAVLDDLDRTAQRPLLIVYANQQQLTGSERFAGPAPDIVIFDESFVDREVPFGAFAATKRLYRRWNRRGMTTFHSTTYQPNTISALHLVSCLRQAAPEFIERHGAALRRIETDAKFRHKTFRELYSRSLAKLTSAAGLAGGSIRASGHYISLPGRRIFDAVAGVACSVRGHNPPSYVDEISQTGDLELCREELSERLARLTGLAHMVPAVSGASAVEHALKLGLASQAPRDWVLALTGGFGGKTLFALTGTWKSSLKAGLSPLYPNVVFVDPFADDAAGALESAFREHPIGVVQVELVQGVGGVRALPAPVLKRLAELRRQNECLLFVDEVQTGMYRTGPFIRSRQLGIEPDLVTIGKGTSDMMFPFALTLYSDAVQERLAVRECPLPDSIRSRYEYETGLRTVLSTLRRADESDLEGQVRERSELLARLLRERLANCRIVRDVRCFGLLIGIELDAPRRLKRWLKNVVSQLYLLAMLEDHRFPLLVGFCQYEPNVLKLTPPLSVTVDEIHGICGTISAVLHRPFSRVAISGLRRMAISRFLQEEKQ